MTRNRAVGIVGLVGLLLLLALLWMQGSSADGEDLGDRERSSQRTDLSGSSRPSPSYTPDGAGQIPDLSAGGLLGPDLDGLDPATMVSCAVEPPLPAASVEIIDDALAEIPEVARIIDGLLVIPAPRRSGSGVLKVSGYVPVHFSWAGGRCLSEPLELVVGGAAVVGMVYNADGEPEGAVQVFGCGGSAKTDRDGSYYLEAIPGRECSLSASREDGLFTATSPSKRVTPQVDEDQVVDLHLPPFRTAGLGIVIRQTPEGLTIDRVLSEGSASDAGLQKGDRVLEIDGEDAGMLSLEEFVELAVGEAGSEVEVRVEGVDGVVRTVVLDRREM